MIVLDEPTNDLDLPTLRVIEEAVLAFDGCALLVSHDRYFLNRVCTHTIVFEEDGQLVLLAGNYDDYMIYKQKKEAAQDAAVPKQTKPKPSVTRVRPRAQGLTYKEQQELAGMHDAIEAAEAEVSRLEAVIHERGFYEQEYTAVQATLGGLAEAKRRVETLYARWEDLEARQVRK